MKFGVVVFPGSNCDDDMVYTLGHIMKQNVVKLWHKDHDLEDCDFIILPGGFSYGDYLRSGAIARFSPIMKEVIGFANNGGYVFGVCNGFQILCEAGLLPGTLLHNFSPPTKKIDSGPAGFICKNIFLKAEHNDSLLTSGIDTSAVLKIPIGNGEGNYYCDGAALQSLKDNSQILFRYCDEGGNVTPQANPNGSVENIAGICNKEKNVFAMMPHPERASDIELGNTDGRAVFESILQLESRISG